MVETILVAAGTAPGPRSSWTLKQVETYLDAVYRHVALVYPLLNAKAVTRGAFEHLARSSRAEVIAVGVLPWLLRAIRRSAWAGEPDREVARRRNMEAIGLALWDTAAAAADTIEAQRVVQAFRRLPIDEQELLRMESASDLSVDELATVLELDRAAVLEKRAAAATQLDGLCASAPTDPSPTEKHPGMSDGS